MVKNRVAAGIFAIRTFRKGPDEMSRKITIIGAGFVFTYTIRNPLEGNLQYVRVQNLQQQSTAVY